MSQVKSRGWISLGKAAVAKAAAVFYTMAEAQGRGTEKWTPIRRA